jgi:hypothetical protein
MWWPFQILLFNTIFNRNLSNLNVQSQKQSWKVIPYEGGGPMTAGWYLSGSKGLVGVGRFTLRAVGKLYKLELSIEARGDDARELCFKRATLIFTRPIVRCKDIYILQHILHALWVPVTSNLIKIFFSSTYNKTQNRIYNYLQNLGGIFLCCITCIFIVDAEYLITRKKTTITESYSTTYLSKQISINTNNAA